MYISKSFKNKNQNKISNIYITYRVYSVKEQKGSKRIKAYILTCGIK